MSRKRKLYDVIIVLDGLVAICSAPENIHRRNLSELIANLIKDLCRESGTNIRRIQLGVPEQNGIFKIFNSRLRDEVFLSEIFMILAETRLLHVR